MRIRPATVDDADATALVHIRSWQAAYRGVFPDEFLDALEVESRAALWRELLAETGLRVLVAADDGVRAFTSFGASRDDDADSTTGEILAIYAHPDAWGSGAGRVLLTSALEALHADGFLRVTLWVLAGNDRAIRAYERAGFVADGAAKDDTLAGTVVTEVRYLRDLP